MADSAAESILDGIKTLLDPLTEAQGGPLLTCEVFGGDWARFQQEVDHISPGAVLYNTGFSVNKQDAASQAFSLTYQIRIIIFDFGSRGATDRAVGFPGNPGVYGIEEAIVKAVAGQSVPTVGLDGGDNSLPILIVGTDDVEIGQDFTVRMMSMTVKTPAISAKART